MKEPVIGLKRWHSRRRMLALTTLGCLFRMPRSAAAAEAYTLRMNVATAPDSMFALTALRIAAAVQRRSNGQLRIDVYPSGQLASQQESITGLATGVLDLTMTATAFLVPLLPRYQAFDMPFLFKNLSTCYRALDGPLGDAFFAELEGKGITGLSWVGGGFRQLETTTRPVSVPDDMKGLRIRIVNAPVYVATYQALGAIPVSIDLSETFMALQQHTVDAMDISLDSVVLGKYYTTVKHVAMLNHILNLTPLMGSKRKLDALPPPLVSILKDESKAALPYLRSLAAKREADAERTLKKAGVAFTDVQYAAFRKAVEPVYTAYRAKIGSDLIDRIAKLAPA